MNTEFYTLAKSYGTVYPLGGMLAERLLTLPLTSCNLVSPRR